MREIAVRVYAETPPDTTTEEGKPCCPACNGPMMLLVRFYRCSRCSFALCVGCEAPPVDGGAY